MWYEAVVKQFSWELCQRQHRTVAELVLAWLPKLSLQSNTKNVIWRRDVDKLFANNVLLVKLGGSLTFSSSILEANDLHEVHSDRGTLNSPMLDIVCIKCLIFLLFALQQNCLCNMLKQQFHKWIPNKYQLKSQCSKYCAAKIISSEDSSGDWDWAKYVRYLKHRQPDSFEQNGSGKTLELLREMLDVAHHIMPLSVPMCVNGESVLPELLCTDRDGAVYFKPLLSSRGRGL